MNPELMQSIPRQLISNTSITFSILTLTFRNHTRSRGLPSNLSIRLALRILLRTKGIIINRPLRGYPMLQAHFSLNIRLLNGRKPNITRLTRHTRSLLTRRPITAVHIVSLKLRHYPRQPLNQFTNIRSRVLKFRKPSRITFLKANRQLLLRFRGLNTITLSTHIRPTRLLIRDPRQVPNLLNLRHRIERLLVRLPRYIVNVPRLPRLTFRYLRTNRIQTPVRDKRNTLLLRYKSLTYTIIRLKHFKASNPILISRSLRRNPNQHPDDFRNPSLANIIPTRRMPPTIAGITPIVLLITIATKLSLAITNSHPTLHPRLLKHPNTSRIRTTAHFDIRPYHRQNTKAGLRFISRQPKVNLQYKTNLITRARMRSPPPRINTVSPLQRNQMVLINGGRQRNRAPRGPFDNEFPLLINSPRRLANRKSIDKLRTSPHTRNVTGPSRLLVSTTNTINRTLRFNFRLHRLILNLTNHSDALTKFIIRHHLTLISSFRRHQRQLRLLNGKRLINNHFRTRLLA